MDREPRLVDSLAIALRLASRELTTELQSAGLSLDHWRVLRRLDEGEGRLMGELSETLCMPPASTTRAVDGLVDRGLAFRKAAEADRRQVVVVMSAAGRDVADRLEEQALRLERNILPDNDIEALDELVARLDSLAEAAHAW